VSRAEKQMIVISYLMMRYPNITVGRVGRLLDAWEYKTGNVLNIKG
jgi:hypothetical protein